MASAGSVWAGSGWTWPAVLMGAASSAYVVLLLAEEGFSTPWSEDAARMHHAASLLSTIMLMAAWMFVNWCAYATYTCVARLCARLVQNVFWVEEGECVMQGGCVCCSAVLHASDRMAKGRQGQAVHLDRSRLSGMVTDQSVVINGDRRR